MKLGQALTLTFSIFMLGHSSSGYAQEVFRARLSPMPTTPQTVNEILGEGEVLLTLTDQRLEVAGHFTGMSSAATSAHLHNGPPAQPGPVVQVLEIDAATDGEIRATLELTDEQLTALRNNALYIQVHSETNAAGELRGWIFLRSHFDRS
ncbi:MAG: CHRD domain-containing protein [Pseudomonadota bacterium]|nr:CHRD domain-containing protein [Pseudomonadota bacterium]